MSDNLARRRDRESAAHHDDKLELRVWLRLLTCTNLIEGEVRTRLRQLLLTDEIPDPRDVVLLSLVDSCNLMGQVLSPQEAEQAAERIQQLSRLDLIGQQMANAIAEIRFILRNAVIVH